MVNWLWDEFFLIINMNFYPILAIDKTTVYFDLNKITNFSIYIYSILTLNVWNLKELNKNKVIM